MKKNNKTAFGLLLSLSLIGCAGAPKTTTTSDHETFVAKGMATMKYKKLVKALAKKYDAFLARYPSWENVNSSLMHRYFKAEARDFRRELVEAQRLNPEMCGHLQLAVSLTPSGHVVEAVVLESSVPSDEIHHRVTRLVRSMHFPRQEQPSIRVFRYELLLGCAELPGQLVAENAHRT